MKRKALTLFITVTMVLSAFALPACGKGKKSADLEPDTSLSMFYKSKPRADLIYVIKASDMTPAERYMIASLQGLVARTVPAIYINEDENAASANWLNEYKAGEGFETQNVSDPWALVDIFRDYITGRKYVLFNPVVTGGLNYADQSVNYAATVCGQEGWLMVASESEGRAISEGLTLGRDVRTGVDTTSIFREYKDRLNKKFLVHQVPEKWQLRDYAIAGGALCFYADFYDGNMDVKGEILDWAEENAPVLGWTENEVGFVESNSMRSAVTTPADWAANLSFTSSFDGGKPKQKTGAPVTAQSGKHYVAVVMSDGDNVQWMSRNFAYDQRFFGSRYRGDFKMTWTVSPALYDLNSGVLNYLYDKAQNNQEFIAGPSGVGYANMTSYNPDSLGSLSALTASYMKKADLSVVNLIDGSADVNAVKELARYTNIKGGVWSVGNKYIAGAGAVYWSNGKPFVTARETFWRLAGDLNSNKYWGYVERVAQRVNAYKKDPTVIEGYTLILAHAWSTGSMEYISRFAEMLDDSVEMVTAGELIDLVTKNVRQKDVTSLNDIKPSDFDARLCPISSEQYRVPDFDGMTVLSDRGFDLSSRVAANKWNYGSGGLQYDFAGYKNGAVLLDGSDMQDLEDPLPNSWMYAKFGLATADEYLYLNAKAGKDSNLRVRVIETASGKIVSESLAPENGGKALNAFGYYLLNDMSPAQLYYSLRDYAGKTVIISIEQDDSGEGSGEDIRISALQIRSENGILSNRSSWNIRQIIQEWDRIGKVETHSEGVCLENYGEAASISCLVTVPEESACLKFYLRKFVRKGEQDDDPKVVMCVNGKVIRAIGATEDFVTVSGDQYIGFGYDLSEYAGQNVTVKFTSIEGQHACINGVLFT